MSYQSNWVVRVSSFPGPMTLEEVEKVSDDLREVMKKAAEEFLMSKFINVPVLRVHGPSVIYLSD